MLNFNIPEKLFILSIDDHRGAIASSAKNTLGYGLAGALLAELALANKIKLQGTRLAVIDVTPTGDALLDNTLAEIVAQKKNMKFTRWLETHAGKPLIKQIAMRLADQKAIHIEKKRYLWVIPYEVYPQVDASAKYWVKQHLRGIVLAGEPAQAPDVALLSLLKACRLLRLVYTKDEFKYASKKVAALAVGDNLGNAVAKLVDEIDQVWVPLS